MKRFILGLIVAFFALLYIYTFEKIDILSTSELESYVEKFNKSDNELYPQHIPNENAFEFLSENIFKLGFVPSLKTN